MVLPFPSGFDPAYQILCFRQYILAAIQWNRGIELVQTLKKWIRAAFVSKLHAGAGADDVADLTDEASYLDVSGRPAPAAAAAASATPRKSGRKVRFQDQEASPPEKRYALGRAAARYARTLVETPALREAFRVRHGDQGLKKTFESFREFLLSTIPVGYDIKSYTPFLIKPIIEPVFLCTSNHGQGRCKKGKN
jgi:hypothetical protein